MRDIFKQKLVDSLEPSYGDMEKLLVERIGQLFPKYKLDFLIEEFTYPSGTLL